MENFISCAMQSEFAKTIFHVVLIRKRHRQMIKSFHIRLIHYISFHYLINHGVSVVIENLHVLTLACLMGRGRRTGETPPWYILICNSLLIQPNIMNILNFFFKNWNGFRNVSTFSRQDAAIKILFWFPIYVVFSGT